MSISFTKLFSSITESTIWVEPDHVRVTWITMLAMADRKGRVWGSIPGLANRARVSVEHCEDALNRFQSPDKYSRTTDYDGRRIEPIDGGWRLLNYDKYREIRDEERVCETKRNYAAKRRAENVDQSRLQSPTVDQSRPQSIQAEAEAEAEAGKREIERAVVFKTPLQVRAEKLHGKRESTPWDKSELAAWKTAKPIVEATTEEDWVLLEKFYAAPQEITYARKSLAVTLNTWNGEITKAREWLNKPQTAQPPAPAFKRVFLSDLKTIPLPARAEPLP